MPPTDAIGKVMRGLDADMTAILEKNEIDDGEKVQLYNQVLQRYNALTDRRFKKPTRLVVENDDDAPVETPRVVDADVIAAVSKTKQTKAKWLMEHLKKKDVELTRIDTGRYVGTRKQHDGSRPVEKEQSLRMTNVCTAQTHQATHGVDR